MEAVNERGVRIKFQSLTGRLKTSQSRYITPITVFQSLTGRLKTGDGLRACADERGFQSLTGRLKTAQRARDLAAARERFNPSQVG